MSPHVAIVGAGVSGLALGILLRRAGLESFTIFDAADRVGGTWRDNTYPGAACDIPSHLYSYSFAPDPSWSRAFAGQAEILAYLERQVRDHDLAPHLRLGERIDRATFDEAAGRWRLRTAAGEEATADVLVAATGQLSRPREPDIPGLESFAGARFHSARWDHGHDLRGERVAVIGSGASAIQIVPEVAKIASRLTVFQQSASYVLPKPERDYGALSRRLFAAAPPLARAYRAWIYLMLEARFPAFSRGSAMGRFYEWAADRERRAQVADPVLRARLTPDHPLGCKRILISNDWYSTLQRPHVELVDDAIVRADERALYTRDGRRFEVDAIVSCTGFQTTRFLSPMRVVGRGGEALEDRWRQHPSAYLGMAVPGFPSFFVLYGPNTNLGHNSIIFMVECQARYVVECVRELRRRGGGWVDVRPEAMAAHQRDVEAALAGTVWAEGCSSWYKDASGHVTHNWPHSTLRYWWRTRRPSHRDLIWGPAPDP